MNKYRIAYNIEEVNTLVDAGYKLHTYEYRAGCDLTNIFIMSLSSEKAYDNISNLIDIPPNQVDEYLKQGWIVADSWSKLIRMVKKQ